MVAVKSEGTGSDLWLIDSMPGGKNDRFTFTPGVETSPMWSPDGSQIIYAAGAGSVAFDLFRKPTNLTGKEEEVFKSPERKLATDWSRDGKTLVFSSGNNGTEDVWTMSVADKKATEFVKTEASEISGRLSPDGRWMAYASRVTGRNEVYVRAFPVNAAGGQQMVSLGGGGWPLWRRDGKELFYRGVNNTVMAVEVTQGAALKFGQPKPLFQHGSLSNPFNGPDYLWDVTADGSRFLVGLSGTGAAAAVPLTLVLNWTSGLK